MEYGSRPWFEHMFSRAAQGEDLWGHQWRAIHKYRYSLTLSLVRENLSERDGQRILDVGCGLGDFTALMYAQNSANEVYGVDIVDAAVKAASSLHPGIRFSTGVLPDIPLDGPFDGIAALECINYLDPYARLVAMKNVASKLKRDGWFLFSGHLGKDVTDRRYFSEADVERCMDAAGFSIEQRVFNYAVLYNKLESIFLRSANLPAKIDAIRNGGAPESKKIEQVLWVLTLPIVGPVVRMAIRLCGVVCKAVLKLLQPPGFIEFMQNLSRRLLGDRGKSHIIVLAFKRS